MAKKTRVDNAASEAVAPASGAVHSSVASVNASESPTQSRRLRRSGQLLALVLVIAIAGMWAITRSAWYLKRQWAGLPLVALERERSRRENNPTFLYYLGLRLNQAGRFGDAAPVLERAVGLEPDSPEAREQWARALIGNGQISAAFVELRQFVGTHPRSGGGHLSLGKFYLAQHTLEKAIAELEEATRLEPKNGEAWSYLGTARLGNTEVANARIAAEKAVALRPRSGLDQLQLAMIYSRLNLNDAARSAFEKAISLSPTLPNIHKQYANWLLDHQNSPEDRKRAEAETRQALAMNGDDADALLMLGRLMVESSREAEAVPILERAATLDPIEPAAPLMLSQVYHRQGETAKSRQWRGLYLTNLKRQANRSELLNATSINPKDHKAQRGLARALADWGDVRGCLRHMAMALDLPVDSRPVLLESARDLIAVGHPDEALKLCGQVLASLPADATAHEISGDAWLALEQSHRAAVEYEQAALALPDRRETYRQRLEQFFKRHRSASPKTNASERK